MDDLPDINVWVALSVLDHAHNPRAIEYIRSEAQPRLGFCGVTAMGFVRVLTGPHSLTSPPLSVVEAWRAYRTWQNRPEVSYLGEPHGVMDQVDRWIALGLGTSRNSTDMYLAAFAISASLRLVTFDKGFKRFPGLNMLVLE